MGDEDGALAQFWLDWETDQGADNENTIGNGDALARSAGEELLEFLGELHTTFEPPSAPTVPTISVDSSDAVQPTVSRSSLCRRRQREEIERLRQEIEELETQCQRLRGRDSDPLWKQPRKNIDVSVGAEGPRRVPCGVWEQIARYQQELKREAECENATLRGLVDEHRRLAQRIQRALSPRSLQERTRQQMQKNRDRFLAVLGTMAAEYWTNVASSSPWHPIFRAVFHNERLWTDALGREQLQVRVNDRGHAVVEGVFAKVYPFDVTSTSRAVWRAYASQFEGFRGGVPSGTTRSENVLSAELHATLHTKDQSLELRSDVLIHKVHEASGRVVFLWEDCSPQLDLDHEASGAVTSRLVLHSCVSIEALPPRAGVGGSQPRTLMRGYSYSRPRSSLANVDQLVYVAGDQLAQAYYTAYHHFKQLIETSVVDDERNRRTVPVESSLRLIEESV